ncbi:hypothetical protein Hanom_Chr08g00741131 [Helianthus anomalus]
MVKLVKPRGPKQQFTLKTKYQLLNYIIHWSYFCKFHQNQVTNAQQRTWGITELV